MTEGTLEGRRVDRRLTMPKYFVEIKSLTSKKVYAGTLEGGGQIKHL